MANKIGRNDPCPCGSGKKYKNCCMRKEQANTIPAMPGRPRQHEIDEEALTYIKNTFPNSWTLEEVKRDYGKDLRVEIFANGKATGLEFIVQSKGHESFMIVNSDKVAQSLRVATLNYFERTALPILLVVYSAERKVACYLWIRPYIQEVMSSNSPNWRERNGDSEITLHVPLSNVLDKDSADAIWTYVETETARLLNSSGNIPPFSSSKQELLSQGQLSSTRLLRPKITNCLHRARLTNRISEVALTRSIFLHTDAGYGKTWLIHDFIETSKPSSIVWYTFDSSATSAVQFIGTIASELFRQTEHGSRTLSYLRDRRSESKLDEALAILLAELSSVEGGLLIVVEDIHCVSDNVIIAALESLVKERPANSHILLTSRHPLPFNQAKLIGQGLLTVIEQLEIAFRLDELEVYLHDNFNFTLSPTQINYLQQRSDGWIAAIALAASVFQKASSENIEALFDRLTGFNGNLYDFFAQEVYSGLSADTRRLLKRLGLTRVVEPDIVNLFTGNSNGGQILRDLAERNTFLTEDTNGKSYRFHPLFVEFLAARLNDEEGSKTVCEVHSLLAHHYAEAHDWVTTTDHALKAQEYHLAVEALEKTAPIGLNLGYGHAISETIARIPSEWLSKSPALLESKGRAALQVGDIDVALKAFEQAQILYRDRQDNDSLNRLEYLVIEAQLVNGEIDRDEFIKAATRISQVSYEKNDILFGAQVELRMIEVGQALTIEVAGLLEDLLRRAGDLAKRLEQSGEQLVSVQARALATQAHLSMQVMSNMYRSNVGAIRIRENTGHPIPLGKRIALAKNVLEMYQRIQDLYDKAESLAKDYSKIEWATIRTQRIADQAHYLGFSTLITEGMSNDPEAESAQVERERLLNGLLYGLDECASIFNEYHMLFSLAVVYCDAADVYDMLKDISNRNKAAQHAFDLAEGKGWLSIAERSRKIMRNEFTFSSMTQQIVPQGLDKDKDLASYSEEDKKRYVDYFLEAYADVSIEDMRESVMSDMNDMVAAAKQRLEWCQHIQIIQELKHTQSLATMHRTIPKKHIICMLLGHESPKHGYSFDELWPFFKGIYCLGCSHRSLAQ
jgi:hypothetical protein